ncbi:hypothetical protein HHI36_013451 [Cryptolaemus montrouzieri]|uniref:Uncharacterized protein n=1 Tax=Cryptolaemus montrouzieri TaxID=559131 RepID=A0ABD2NIC4_9CUCU
MTYAICYDFDMMSKIPNQDSFLQNFNRMRLESSREQPVLYVTMATWIPKCNVYHHIIDSQRAHRSRQYERGSSAERRYKRSHRRSPTSKKRHRHRYEKSSSRKNHSRRSRTSEQVSILIFLQFSFDGIGRRTVRTFTE